MGIGKNAVRVLIAGCGNMGASHAKAYEHIDGCKICGLVSRGSSKQELNSELNSNYALYSNFDEALRNEKPDAVCIASYTDTHEEYAVKALEAGCHVFLEKPLAASIAGAEHVLLSARKSGRKLMVGYILRHHPSWQKFIELARGLGKPLIMRMNLNQQSSGNRWVTHLNLLESLSPIVDCGVHYIDVMCQMTGAKPVSVSAIGARLSDEVKENNYNYGQLQIRFDDGSAGWYEAGWGPMISETAFFIKDVIGPRGSVSIAAKDAGSECKSDVIEAHTKTELIRVHYADTDKEHNFTQEDEWINLADEPDHQELCIRQQQYFLKAIQENIDLTSHQQDALNSLKIAFACDESFRTGGTVYFKSNIAGC